MLYWGGSRNLTDKYVKTWANKAKGGDMLVTTMYDALSNHIGKYKGFFPTATLKGVEESQLS